MDFLKSQLQPGEEIKYRARIHYFLFAEPLCLLTTGGFILCDASVPVMKWLAITVLFLGLVSLAQRMCVKAGSLFVVTNRRVILKTGIIRRRVAELVLNKCEGIFTTILMLNGRLKDSCFLCIFSIVLIMSDFFFMP